MGLTRNKRTLFIFFFGGGTLFIIVTLPVAVHLASFLLPPIPLPPSSSACLPLLHDNVFFSISAAAAADEQISWYWSRSKSSCGFQKLTPSDASHLLTGSWVMVAGDSQARLLLLALLTLLLPPSHLQPIRADLLHRRHDNHQIIVPLAGGLKLDFVWAPFEHNVTALLDDLRSRARDSSTSTIPDVIVIGDGLWHMLHLTNPSHYALALASIRSSAYSLLAARPHHPLTMFWLGMPVLINSKLNREEKRTKMNDTMWNAYQEEVHGSKILRQGGGPFHLLDIGLLSRRCGGECAVDGMHYREAVYDAAAQLMLNALSMDLDSQRHQRSTFIPLQPNNYVV